jgi:hypothetical protein
LEGDELRVGYGMETVFLGRVNSVKVKTLFGSGRVKSGPGQVTGLRCFPYSGAIELAGLGSWVIQVKFR